MAVSIVRSPQFRCLCTVDRPIPPLYINPDDCTMFIPGQTGTIKVEPGAIKVLVDGCSPMNNCCSLGAIFIAFANVDQQAAVHVTQIRHYANALSNSMFHCQRPHLLEAQAMVYGLDILLKEFSDLDRPENVNPPPSLAVIVTDRPAVMGTLRLVWLAQTTTESQQVLSKAQRSKARNFLADCASLAIVTTLLHRIEGLLMEGIDAVVVRYYEIEGIEMISGRRAGEPSPWSPLNPDELSRLPSFQDPARMNEIEVSLDNEFRTQLERLLLHLVVHTFTFQFCEGRDGMVAETRISIRT